MSEAEEEMTLDRNMGPEMDLVNRPNPWLPAYGFQIQHHNFQPTNEDLRANDTMLVQQMDYLETILEETSDDLQSDSDRSSTTYWIGSDSDTESVIHIKTGQRTTDEKQDGSGSECNSVVPKKRRRKNGSELQLHGSSPRSSRDSSASSRSSSLLQFESLERTCATLSPSSYSFDSLEYQRANSNVPQSGVVAAPTTTASNGTRHHHHHHHHYHSRDQASPDSLELQDYGQLNGNYLPDLPRESGDGVFGRLRPYRSFESLEKDLLPREQPIGGLLSNGFASHAFGKNCDLSRVARRPRSRRRNQWQLNDADGYSDYEDSSENLSSPEDDEEDHEYGSTRYNEVDQLLVFGEQCSTYAHTASLDCRNSVDLRDFGLDSDDEEKRRENTLLDLKAAARLSIPGSTHASLDYSSLNELADEEAEDDGPDYGDIDPSVQLRHRRHHHHHAGSGAKQHHHHRRPQYSAESRLSGGSGCGAAGISGNGTAPAAGAGSAGSGRFNFRFGDTWRSAPSLPASLLESAAASASSSASLLRDERFTRVSSVPVDLDLCGRRCSEPVASSSSSTSSSSTSSTVTSDDTASEGTRPAEHEPREPVTSPPPEQPEPAEPMADVMTIGHDELAPEEVDLQPGKMVGEEKARLRKRAKELSSSVKTQDSQRPEAGPEERDRAQRPPEPDKPLLTSTVKTQDPLESSVLGLAIALQSNVEGVGHEPAALGLEELAAALEGADVPAAAQPSGSARRRVKNNASYELAQQAAVDEDSLDGRRPGKAPKPRRVVNNASYELAQQNDVLKNMSFQYHEPYFLMDTCEEQSEPSGSGHSSRLKISELVEEMSGSVSSLLAQPRDTYGVCREPRTLSKSTENVQRQPSSPEPRRLMETSLLGRAKKNSDHFSSSGEGSGKPYGALSAASSPCVLSIDDEVDYPCLLENKPLLVEHKYTIEETRGGRDGDAAEPQPGYESEPEEAGEIGKEYCLGSYYPVGCSEPSGKCAVSKSCEDVRGRVNERLWRLVVEKQQAAMEKESSSATAPQAAAVARRLVFAPPPQRRQRAGSPESAAAATASATSLSSPAAASAASSAASIGSASSGPSSSASDGHEPCSSSHPQHPQHPQQQQQQPEPEPEPEEAGTVQPRAAEMSATAAKRLAMSGEPTLMQRSNTSMNTLNTSSSSVREEKKKGGLGGFLQRFSRLRFSGRSKVPRSELQKKSSANNSANSVSAGGGGVSVSAALAKRSANNSQQQQAGGKKKEPDYIIIPLHPPEEERRRDEDRSELAAEQKIAPSATLNGRPPVSAKKPPLPPQSLRASSGGAGGGSGGGGSGAAVGSGGGSSYSGYGFGGVAGVGVSGSTSRRRAATDLGNPAAIEMAKARAAMLASQDHPQHHHQHHQHQQQRQQYPSRPAGLLETDLDAPVDPEEAAAKKARSLLNLNHNGHPAHHLHHQPHHHQAPALSVAGPDGRYRHPDHEDALLLDVDDEDVSDASCCRTAGPALNHHHRAKQVADTAAGHQRPHKSMEFLLDKENLHFVKPPENELQKVGERTPSEHELRVQRSLQRLNVPDWYKNSSAARDGPSFRLKRHSDASQHGGWRTLGSKTTSLSSLSSSSNRQPTTGTLLSPSPTPPVFSRWSTSLLNSAGSSPASSARSSFNHRQPYLGWRSQERLANPRTPAERLAQGILPQLQNSNKQQQQQQQEVQSCQAQSASQQQPGAGNQTTNQEVRNSIKEVTSAIVHYVQSGQEVVGGGGGGRLSPRPGDWDDARSGARSTSPRGSTRMVWMESSFVGVRPVESPPDTPAGISVPTAGSGGRPSNCSLPSPSRSSLHDSTATSTLGANLTLTSLRSGTGGVAGGETSEDGSTPGVCGPDDAGFVSLSGGSTTELADTGGGSSFYLDLVQSPRDDSSSPVIGLPQDHRHRQRRHRRQDADSDSLQRRERRERRESPSPTLLLQQQQQQLLQQDGAGQQQHHQHHQSRHRQRAEPEQHQHRPHQQQQQSQQQHQRGELLLA